MARALRIPLALLLLTFASAGGAAQTSERALRFLNHAVWTGDDGPPLTGVHTLARTPDGYLWLGANNGILRFDGVRFAILDSSVSPALKSTAPGLFSLLLVDRSGALWIERPDRAVITYRDGAFRVVLPPGSPGTDITVDGAGRWWFYGGDSGIYQLNGNRLARVRLPAGVPDSGVMGIVRDTGQGIWIGTRTQGLWHVGGDRGERLSPLNAVPSAQVLPLIQSRDGTMWASGAGVGTGLHRLVNGRWLPVAPRDSGTVIARSAIEDSAGALWFGTTGHGVLRWQAGELETFNKSNGLSDASVDELLSDANGTVWIATAIGGLDRLRNTAFVTLDRHAGLPFDTPDRVVEDASGSLWASGVDAPWPLELSGSALGGHAGPVVATRANLPRSDSYEILCGARGGGVWLGPRLGGLIRYRNGHVERWTANDGLPKRRIWYAVETRDSSLWLATLPAGFGVLRHGRYTAFPLPGASMVNISAAVEDGKGALWVATVDSAFVYEIFAGQIVRRLSHADGLVSPISELTLEHGDTLWGASDSGFVRIIDGRVSMVRNASLASVVSPTPSLTVAGGSLWLASAANIARLSLSSLNAAADGHNVDVALRLFGPADGLPTPRRPPFSILPTFRARDGRLWVSTPGGLAMLDPARDFSDRSAPEAHVEETTASGQTFRGDSLLTLPPNPSRTSIHYTVTSLLEPERTRVQYRLDGVDSAWINGGSPRVATYTQLRPGAYEFHVRGWNEDNVASPREATLAFRVLPAWYQSLWYRAAMLGALIAAVMAAAVTQQRRRARLATERLRVQFETTLAERTRIARELHDTLLQGFTGIVLQLEGLRQRLPNAPSDNAADLSRILTLADSTLLEARQSVWNMRQPAHDQQGLVEAFQEIGRELVVGDNVRLAIAADNLHGPLPREVEAAARHIGREAIRNAVKHAQAPVVTVELAYVDNVLTLAVADDGIGMSDDQLDLAARGGHFGILGMRERAARAGGALHITSSPGEGTRIDLTLPARTNRRHEPSES